MKEKAETAPKELVRCGLGGGTERLRVQLRDTAQHGQTDEYGGDRIENTAVGGARRAKRGVENLLKKKKKSRNRKADDDSRIPDEPSADLETPEMTPQQEAGDCPRIKTREAVTHSAPTDREPMPQAGQPRVKQPRIRTRESDSYTPLSGETNTAPADGTTSKPSPQAGRERAQIKTRESGISDSNLSSDAAEQPAVSKPDRPAIKTKEAYLQRQTSASPEQMPQNLAQGQREFMREQGRRSAMKRTEARRTANGSIPQERGGEDASPSVPARRRYAAERRGYNPARPAQRKASPGNSDTRPVQGNGNRLVKTARSGRKAPEHIARHAVKTAERSSKKAVKTAQRTAKTAEKTVKTAQKTVKTAQKTAQATVKATQRAVQAARAAAKATAEAVKAAVKATIAAVKAAIAAIQELVAAIAAGGWVVVVVILVICLVGLLIASIYGIFFADDDTAPDAVSPPVAVAQINRELAAALSNLQAGGSYDSVVIVGSPPSWADVFAVFSVKTVTGDGVDAVVLDEDRVERLRTVFWDMTKITTETTAIEHPVTEDDEAWTETMLTITVTPRTTDDMRVFYQFTQQQNEALDELLTAEVRAMWQELLYGDCGEIVAVALFQVGSVGGQPYWSWYGFDSRVEWCACFVSWCANECGYIDAGVIPKFSGCTGGSNWFKNRNLWQDNSYEPRPGDIIFFDWDNKGSSGPQDNVPDHVGIVERVEDGVVYTVEGNSGDSCRQRSYSVGYYEIWGYGTPIY